MEIVDQRTMEQRTAGERTVSSSHVLVLSVAIWSVIRNLPAIEISIQNHVRASVSR